MEQYHRIESNTHLIRMARIWATPTHSVHCLILIQRPIPLHYGQRCWRRHICISFPFWWCLLLLWYQDIYRFSHIWMLAMDGAKKRVWFKEVYSNMGVIMTMKQMSTYSWWVPFGPLLGIAWRFDPQIKSTFLVFGHSDVYPVYATKGRNREPIRHRFVYKGVRSPWNLGTLG